MEKRLEPDDHDHLMNGKKEDKSLNKLTSFKSSKNCLNILSYQMHKIPIQTMDQSVAHTIYIFCH